MKTLGACMIVKNEESCLENCLESIRGLDEIVILDTGSTDNTGTIARRYTEKYIAGVYQWEDDFSKARNKALEYCTADWILVIDADETLSEGGIEIIRQAIQDDSNDVLRMICVSAQSNAKHIAVRVHKRHPDIYWKGAAHNYLTAQDGALIAAKITYGWSDAHNLDPDRTLRILKRAIIENPDKPRERYYLANEYFRRGMFDEAKEHYSKYLDIATWAPEYADACIMMSKTSAALNESDLAYLYAFKALRINADLKEALQMLALLSGPDNRAKWLEYAKLANNTKALFDRSLDIEETEEKGAEYYAAIYSAGYDTSRYDDIYRTVAGLCRGRVIDMGCGTGDLKKYMPDGISYTGFDFAGAAHGDGFHKGDIYTYPLEGYDIYVCLEVLEHVDDIRVLERIPKGSTVIFSVPSFNDISHLRTYTLDILADRYQDYFSDMEVRRFNFIDNKWRHVETETDQYILLVKAVKK